MIAFASRLTSHSVAQSRASSSRASVSPKGLMPDS